MTTTDNPSIELAALLSRMRHWEDHAEDREDVCVKCGEFSGNNQPEHEPSPLCNSCAQDLATRTFPDQLEEVVAERDALRARVDPVELHRTVHQAAFYELDMGTTWTVERVKEFAERIAKHVVDVSASDRSEADRLRARIAELEITQLVPGDAPSPTAHRAEHPPSDVSEVSAVLHILGASPSETLRQAAERVVVNCAERARERDAARWADETRQKACKLLIAERDAARSKVKRALVRLLWDSVADDAPCTCDAGIPVADICPQCEAMQALGFERWIGAEDARIKLQ